MNNRHATARVCRCELRTAFFCPVCRNDFGYQIQHVAREQAHERCETSLEGEVKKRTCDACLLRAASPLNPQTNRSQDTLSSGGPIVSLPRLFTLGRPSMPQIASVMTSAFDNQLGAADNGNDVAFAGARRMVDEHHELPQLNHYLSGTTLASGCSHTPGLDAPEVMLNHPGSERHTAHDNAQQAANSMERRSTTFPLRRRDDVSNLRHQGAQNHSSSLPSHHIDQADRPTPPVVREMHPTRRTVDRRVELRGMIRNERRLEEIMRRRQSRIEQLRQAARNHFARLRGRLTPPGKTQRRPTTVIPQSSQRVVHNGPDQTQGEGQTFREAGNGPRMRTAELQPRVQTNLGIDQNQCQTQGSTQAAVVSRPVAQPSVGQAQGQNRDPSPSHPPQRLYPEERIARIEATVADRIIRRVDAETDHFALYFARAFARAEVEGRHADILEIRFAAAVYQRDVARARQARNEADIRQVQATFWNKQREWTRRNLRP